MPIYKSDGCDNPSNYRGITITSCVGKLFTSVINQRIIKFVEKQRIVSHHQKGLKKSYRTADHIFIVKALINKYLHKGKKLYLCFVDFKKAYDSVWRNGLFYKLINCGFGTKILGILKSVYDNTLSCVKLSRGLTNSFKSSVGVCQGCNLNPILFNIFINDFIELFSPSDLSCFPVKLKSMSLNCLLYADDLLLMSETETGIQNCLNKLHVYCKKWCLKINMKKTQYLVINRNGKQPKCNLHFGDNIVKQTNECCYLGVMITACGSFSSSMKMLYKKGLKAMFCLLNNVNKTKQLPVKILLDLFDKMISPVILYNYEVWGASLLRKNYSEQNLADNLFHLKCLQEDLHMKFMKIALGVNSKATNFAVRSELGRFPLHIKIYTAMLKYWNRLNNFINNRIINDVIEGLYLFIDIIRRDVNESDWISSTLE